MKGSVSDPSLHFISTDIVQNKSPFFEYLINSHLINISYHWGIFNHWVAATKLICEGYKACVFRFEEILFFFQIIAPDTRFKFCIRDYSVSFYLSQDISYVSDDFRKFRTMFFKTRICLFRPSVRPSVRLSVCLSVYPVWHQNLIKISVSPAWIKADPDEQQKNIVRLHVLTYVLLVAGWPKQQAGGRMPQPAGLCLRSQAAVALSMQLCYETTIGNSIM